MKYTGIVSAEFIERPNRFVAYVELMGVRTKVHVKNTGRCLELLTDHAKVYLEKSGKETRSTAYDLVAVEKEGRLVNMDSGAPNRVAGEWLRAGGLFKDVSLVRPEKTFGSSRFDFYVESASGRKAFIEVKGVTLERDHVAAFPDAPSERALKHVEELIEACAQGYEAYLLFVVQMKGARYVEPNWDTQPAFGDALRRARRAGVRLLAYDCLVGEDSLEMDVPVPVCLDSLDRIAEPLLAWYDKGRRILPWREEPTPYHVWLSEIMLQQTRVEAVKPYFERFMMKLPDIEALAEADEETLLKLWEGLGYYNRVRNLQRAARQIQEDFGGSMPDTREKLMTLAGIGSYTAGAVASIAFQRPEPAVDGNVLRVLARFRRDDRMISDAGVKDAVERELREIIPKNRPGDFNQAVMEIGACVCIPHGAPLCGQCPLGEHCAAHRDGAEAEYPKKQAKKSRIIEKKTVLVIRDEDSAVVHRRSRRGLLAGMYEFPTMEGYHTADEVVAYLAENGLKTLRIQALEDAKHIFTHREWHMKGYMVRVDELEPKKSTGEAKDWIYIEPEETRERIPIPSAFGAYAKYLGIKIGKVDQEEEK